MKLSKSKLRSLIKEEVKRIVEMGREGDSRESDNMLGAALELLQTAMEAYTEVALYDNEASSEDMLNRMRSDLDIMIDQHEHDDSDSQENRADSEPSRSPWAGEADDDVEFPPRRPPMTRDFNQNKSPWRK